MRKCPICVYNLLPWTCHRFLSPCEQNELQISPEGFLRFENQDLTSEEEAQLFSFFGKLAIIFFLD